jgi:guanylate kinase
MKTVFLIVGKSASGKDTLVNMLCKYGYKQLCSYTTRPRRIDEGDTHIFITPEEVKNYESEIIAYTKIGEFQYFATKSQLQDADLYVIDPQGVKYMKQAIKDVRLVTIYINLDDESRFGFALKRQDALGVLIKRFIDESEQFKEFATNGDYDYAITNKNLNKSFYVLKEIIEIERSFDE